MDNRIPPREKPGGVEGALLSIENAKKKTARAVINNAGIFVSVFIIFTITVVMTTDIKIGSFTGAATLGLNFYVLLFGSYGMYVNLSDSGSKRGLGTEIYKSALDKYDGLKKQIIELNLQSRLSDFCRKYIEDELESSRTVILANVGISYETYCKKYIGKGKRDIEEKLTRAERNAIKQANNLKPIKLTPDMILKRGRGSNRRAPLGVKPVTKKRLVFGSKFVTTAFTSGIMGVIAFEVIAEPDWSVFAAVLLKILAVILNGFAGYQFGYENIVIDTVNYILDQCDLMEQVLKCEKG